MTYCICIEMHSSLNVYFFTAPLMSVDLVAVSFLFLIYVLTLYVAAELLHITL